MLGRFGGVRSGSHDGLVGLGSSCAAGVSKKARRVGGGWRLVKRPRMSEVQSEKGVVLGARSWRFDASHYERATSDHFDEDVASGEAGPCIAAAWSGFTRLHAASCMQCSSLPERYQESDMECGGDCSARKGTNDVDHM